MASRAGYHVTAVQGRIDLILFMFRLFQRHDAEVDLFTVFENEVYHNHDYLKPRTI